MSGRIAAKSAETFDVQRALIVGLQVFLPPLRGKPFWSLELQDDKNENSMLIALPVQGILCKNCGVYFDVWLLSVW